MPRRWGQRRRVGPGSDRRAGGLPVVPAVDRQRMPRQSRPDQRENQEHGGKLKKIAHANERQRVRRGIVGSIQPWCIAHALVRLA
jgi:hypothetical protein